MKKAVLIQVSLFYFFSTYCNSVEHVDKPYFPTTSYSTFTTSDVRVYISPEITSKTELFLKAKKTVIRQLAEVKKLLPKAKFDQIKNTNIWIELEAKKKVSAEFHIDIEWLNENGYNPEKLNGIEIPSIEYYLSTTIPGKQEYSLLHEFAHALHEILPDEKKLQIKDAYTNAQKSGLYQNVKRFGKTYRKNSYAIANEYEYFSELSEAYFAINDWFPHIQYQLKEYDPKGYNVVNTIWTD